MDLEQRYLKKIVNMLKQYEEGKKPYSPFFYLDFVGYLYQKYLEERKESEKMEKGTEEIYDKINEMYNEIWEDFQRKFVRKFKELLNKYNISLEVKGIEIEIGNTKYELTEHWVKSENNMVNLRDKACVNIKYRLADLKDMLNVLLNREQIFKKMREKAFMENEYLIVSVKNLYKIYKEKEEVEENYEGGTKGF